MEGKAPTPSGEHANPFAPPRSPAVETRPGPRPGWVSMVSAGLTGSLGVGCVLSNLGVYASVAGAVRRLGFWNVVTDQEMSSVYAGAVFTLLTLSASRELFRGRWKRAVAEVAAAVILSWILFALNLYSRGH